MIAWWQRHFLLAEGMVAAIGLAAFTIWIYHEGRPVLSSLDRSSQLSVISTFLSLSGTLLGFVIAAITFLFGIIDNHAFRIVRASRSYRDHWAIFRGAMRACAVATLSSLVGVVVVSFDATPRWLEVLLFAAILWMTIRLARVVWVIEKMIEAEVRLGANTREEATK